MKKHELQSLSQSFFVTKNSMGEGGVLQHRYRTGIALCNPLRNQCVSAQLEKINKSYACAKSYKFKICCCNNKLVIACNKVSEIQNLYHLDSKKIILSTRILNQSSRQWIGGTCE